jgi:hypothetical protein
MECSFTVKMPKKEVSLCIFLRYFYVVASLLFELCIGVVFNMKIVVFKSRRRYVTARKLQIDELSSMLRCHFHETKLEQKPLQNKTKKSL